MANVTARFRLASVIATTLLVALGHTSVTLTAGGISPTTLLDQYARHRFDVVASLGSLSSSERVTFVDNFEQKGAAWETAGGPGATPSRRLILVTAALDVARVWGVGDAWASGRQLVIWSSDILQEDQAPQAAERLWDLAAIAMAEGAEDPALLRGEAGLVARAKARFPNEPRFLLASAVADENDTWNAGRMGTEHLAGGNILPGEITQAYLSRLLTPGGGAREAVPINADAATEITRLKRLTALVRTLESLAPLAPIAAEVNLRAGAAALRLADRDAALRHFHDVERTTGDRDLVYLARLFSGIVYERQNQVDDALKAYRSALDMVPHAQSAEALLVALLVRSGHAADASDEADGFLSADTPEDPWRMYRDGDYRRLPAEFSELQAALR